MWVVKLGGSLFDSDHLRDWLKVLSESGPLVIVPGGGPFADQVRLAQQQWGFDDSTAHRMALLAMEQYGHLLCSLQPGLVPATSHQQIEDLLAAGATPVWMPTVMVMAESDIEHSWEITSDSLAAWLAGELKAAQLLLVKSVTLNDERLTVEQLAEQGIIDTRFGAYLRQSGCQAWTMASHDSDHFKAVYQGRHKGATHILT
jgi:5-(aminomethyl)-3-furanmethanol phosphate kinase